MYPAIVAAAIALTAFAAEILHARRGRTIARLAFGPGAAPAPWARVAPELRVAAMTAVAWGLTTLLLLPPHRHGGGIVKPGDERHLLLLLDVSPSMRLEDAGPDGKQSRRRRAADLLRSFFERVAMDSYKTSIVAVYTEAKPVVVDTRDAEVVRNILDDLPMQYAFTAGPTNLFVGLEEAAKLARPWAPGSTTMIVLSDGDTVPGTGMPTLPVSIRSLLVVGVGDPNVGRFIDGHQSRQELSMLRQVATRLKGTYHNGNEKHLPTELLNRIAFTGDGGMADRLTSREYAFLALGLGSGTLALLPVLLSLFGTRWSPGVPIRPALRTSGG